METILLNHHKEAFGSVIIPGSKSISNRVLLLSALSDGLTKIYGLLESDDVFYMKKALSELGVELKEIDATTVEVLGCKGAFSNKKASFFLGNAGTAFRPLTAALALNNGDYTLDGVPRMHERPIKDLVDGLRQIGLQVDYLKADGYPPLHILPSTINHHELTIKGDVSSQFLTALLLSLPMTKEEVTIHIDGVLISKPYIEITLNLLNDFGIKVINNNWQSFVIPAMQTYHSVPEYFVEPDASSASYFLAMGAIAGRITVKGLTKNCIQGDVKFINALEKMGAIVEWNSDSVTVSHPKEGLQGIDIDCNEIPDAAMTLAIVALYAKGKTTLRNIASWRVKETDRLRAMHDELVKLGVKVIEGEDYLIVEPKESLNENVSIKTYDDHRIAMCFSLCSFKTPIIIEDPSCVNKTFPTYFELFKQVVR